MSFLMTKSVSNKFFGMLLFAVAVCMVSVGINVYEYSLVKRAYAGTEVGSFTAPLIPSLGGTGITSYAIGDIPYASGATTISKLADVATGQVLASGGVTTAPAYTATPTVTSVTASGNTAKAFIYSDASKVLQSTTNPTNGQLLIGSTGNIPAVAVITPGTGISVTNGAGTITIAATGGTKTVTAKTAGYSLLAADSGGVFTTTGAAGTIIFTLPAATAVGNTYTICSDAAQIAELLAVGSDVIRFGGQVSGAAGNVQCTTAGRGNTITLVDMASGEWQVIAATGSTWGVN